MAKKILILNGPNLNMLGKRQPEIYGTQTLQDIEALCCNKANMFGFKLQFEQSNIEGELVTMIQKAASEVDGLIINAGAYTHTSVALYDALKLVKAPVIEVHLSNPGARESFRHQSFITPAAIGVIAGFGAHSYLLALDALHEKLAVDTDRS